MKACIVYVPQLFNTIILFMISRLPQSFWVNCIIYELIYPGFILIYISIIFGHAQLCKNDYFDTNSFSLKGDNCVLTCSLARTTYEVDHPWCLSYHGDFFGVWRSNFWIFRSMLRSLTREQCGVITTLNIFDSRYKCLGIWR